MDGVGLVPVPRQQGAERSKLVHGQVDGPPACVTNQMVVVPPLLAQMDDAGASSQVDVVDRPRLLEGVHRPVHGRQVDGTAQLLLGVAPHLGRGQMPPRLPGEDGADGPAGSSDTHTLPPQSLDERVGSCH